MPALPASNPPPWRTGRRHSLYDVRQGPPMTSAGGSGSKETRRRRHSVAPQQSEEAEHCYRATCACIREVAATVTPPQPPKQNKGPRLTSRQVYKAMGLRSNVGSLTTSVHTASRLAYLGWLGGRTPLLGQHLASAHAEAQGMARRLGTNDAVALLTALAHVAADCNQAVHCPSLANVAAALRNVSACPARFPGIDVSHLAQLIGLLLPRTVNIMDPGAAAAFPDWTAQGSFKAAVGRATAASTAWQHSALIQGCRDELNPAWHKNEFHRYIEHLRHSGMAVDYREWMELHDDYSAQEIEKREAETELGYMQQKLNDMSTEVMELYALNEEQDRRIAAAEEENHRKDQRLLALEKENWSKDQRILALEDAQSKREQRITALEHVNQNQEAEIHTQKTHIHSLQLTIDHLTGTVDSLATNFASLDAVMRAHFPVAAAVPPFSSL
ncbi:hypothetical protein DFH27DRAFT_520366 [Peziza echinospora]|nr:hypothetical protein DFH27DRAFT_520366 [Peziza echinospora]